MRKKGILSKKILHILAVAALSLSLIGGKIQPVFAEDLFKTVKIEDSRILFDTFYLEEGMPLSTIKLPEYVEGTLKWEEKEYIPDEKEAECVIVFTPNKDQDLEKYKCLEGWDSNEKVVKVKVRVIVESFDEENFDVITDDIENECENISEISSEVIDDTSKETSEETADDEELEEIVEENMAVEENIVVEENIADEETMDEEDSEEIIEENVVNEGTVDDADSKTAEIAAIDEIEGEEDDVEEISDAVLAEEINEEPAEEIISEETSNKIVVEEVESTEKEVETENSSEETENKDMPETSIEEASDNTTEETTDNSETIDESAASAEAKKDENALIDIFDRDIEYSEADDTDTNIYDNLSDEEKQKIAEENHCSNGIVVSGENLPWYVQFRAYEVEESMFSINADANVFQCFEFELWDLLNDTEYMIPEGEYVSVSIPVLEGYEYTVEHILENGAIEMITPTVNGTTLIFSTNSFSPFGIAGSTPIVGGEIIDDGYQIPSVQPTVTPIPEATETVQPTATPIPEATETVRPTATPTVTPDSSVGGQTVLVGDDVEVKDNVIDMTDSDKHTQQSNEAGTSNGGTNSSNVNSNKVNSNNTDRNIITKVPVQTGDTTMIIPFVLLVAAAGLAIILVIILKKRKDN